MIVHKTDQLHSMDIAPNLLGPSACRHWMAEFGCGVYAAAAPGKLDDLDMPELLDNLDRELLCS